MPTRCRPILRTFQLAATLALLLGTIVPAARGEQCAADLFFSEYLEGSSLNKALEIYNGTGAAVSLDGVYDVQMCFNGSTSCSIFALNGTVADGDVFVFAAADGDPAIAAAADQTTSSGVFNGDDAVLLRKNGAVIDAIGQVGLDPGSEWGTDLTSTKDNTLRRAGTVASGDTDASDAFDPAAQWIGFANDSFDGLGAHSLSACDPGNPGEDVAVYTIQGTGTASPLAGQTVSTTGIVTAIEAKGFYIQDPAGDGNADSSDGVYVYSGSAPVVSTGDEVRVQATVAEYKELTELTGPTVTILSSRNALPAATALHAAFPSPFGTDDQLETVEGMRVAIASALSNGPTNGYAEIPAVIPPNERAFREPGLTYDAGNGIPVYDGNPEVLFIDTDGLGGTPLDLSANVTVSGIEGIVQFSYGYYTVKTTSIAGVGETLAARPVRDRRSRELTVGSFNVRNLYDDVDNGNGETVTDSQAYQTKLAKLSLAIRTVMKAPDVVALQELENANVLQALAAKIAADDPAITYTIQYLPGPEPAYVSTGYLLRPTVSVTDFFQVGQDETFPNPTTGETEILFDRPPLVLDASVCVAGGAPFEVRVINNHLRSMNDLESAAKGPYVRMKRQLEAEYLARYMQGLQSEAADRRVVLLGDLNAYEFTDGYVDVVGTIKGDPGPDLAGTTDLVEPDLINMVETLESAERYSYTHQGVPQTLDHVLVTQAATGSAAELAYGRANADYPWKLYETDATRPENTSDHDMPVLFMTASEAATGTVGCD
ncbi:MAG: lamin tail domain-containing protein [Candidatus Schekmanbacteria bacterium]|nr:lamin tail domain-containing protein [Candidatus Schekmanbacteria bacterium]